VVPKATYGARSEYTWDDVVALARKIEAGKLRKKDLDAVGADGKLVHMIPRNTMAGWLKDDAEVMRKKGKRGIEGEAHWKVGSPLSLDST
jgi:hypothetical protein